MRILIYGESVSYKTTLKNMLLEFFRDNGEEYIEGSYDRNYRIRSLIYERLETIDGKIIPENIIMTWNMFPHEKLYFISKFDVVILTDETIIRYYTTVGLPFACHLIKSKDMQNIINDKLIIPKERGIIIEIKREENSLGLIKYFGKMFTFHFYYDDEGEFKYHTDYQPFVTKNGSLTKSAIKRCIQSE